MQHPLCGILVFGNFLNLGTLCQILATLPLFWTVVLPGQLSRMDSCCAWTVVYLDSCCLDSCLAGQMSPGLDSCQCIHFCGLGRLHFDKIRLSIANMVKHGKNSEPPLTPAPWGLELCEFGSFVFGLLNIKQQFCFWELKEKLLLDFSDLPKHCEPQNRSNKLLVQKVNS